MKDNRIKVEIAQRELSDLGRGWHANMHRASRKPSLSKLPNLIFNLQSQIFNPKAERVGARSTVGKNLQTSISLDEPVLVLYLAFEFWLIFIQIVAPSRHLSLA